jgi:O-antigen/teichoic acid export membrane protein
VARIRRSIIWVSTGQYVNLALGFVSTLFLARLLTPAEYGVSVLGWAILGIAEALREFASGAFLVREKELTADKIETSVTISILITLIIIAGLMLLARPLSHYFSAQGLDQFLYVTLIGFAMGAILYPQQALLNRELAFSRLAIIGCAMTAAGSAVSVTLAYHGFGVLSFAWASVASFAVGTVLSVCARWDVQIYKPSLRSWRGVLRFGAYSGTTAIVSRIGEAVPVFIFGKVLSPMDLAIGSRAVLISSVVERVVFGPALAVALPEFSRHVREGRDLKESYFKALSFLTAVQWPAMIVLAVLAQPIVVSVMGHQWLDVVPLVRIYGPALMLAVPVGLQYAILSAVDGIHLLPRLLALQTAVMAIALALTVSHGLEAAAWSMYAVFATSSLFSLLAVRSRLAFSWTDLVACLAPSVMVTIFATIGPVVLFLYAPSMTLLMSGATVAMAIVGWIVGLYASSHLMWSEVVHAATVVMNVISRRARRR